MKEYRVQAFFNNEWYGLFYTEEGNKKIEKFALIKNRIDSTIYVNEAAARIEIETHRRSRKDEVVEEYKLIKV